MLAGVSFLPPPSRAALPPAGYEILSRSTAEYLARGARLPAASNLVAVSVGAVYRLQLTPLGSAAQPAFSLEGFAGDSLYCRFELRNTGNAADSVDVAWRLLRQSTIGVAGVLFFHDANGNLVFDPGEDDRAFLNLVPGEAVGLGTLVALSAVGGGESYIGVEAKAGEGSAGYAQESVIRATTRAGSAPTLHIGPADNPKALPAGEGGPDDVSRRSVGFGVRSVVFENDILNEGLHVEIVQIEPADSTGWPPGVDVVVEDSTGNALQAAPSGGAAVSLGELASGERRRIRVRAASAYESFYHATDDSLCLDLRVRSLVDASRTNLTANRVVLAERFNAAAAIALEQTFKENQAGFGDVVTLVVAVRNTTDSVRVDGVVVRETPQPALDFLSGAGFAFGPGGIVWDVGSLGPGERREAVVKFMVNSRVSRGWTRVTGEAGGEALGRGASAGPVVNVLKIDNDVFADEGIVLGEVFVDDNENGKRDEGERGMAGAGVFLESGEYALTDSTGRFSIPRVFSGYRVVRVDEATLSVEQVDKDRIPTRTNAVFGTERLVHLLPSGHAVVSFPLPPGRIAEERGAGNALGEKAAERTADEALGESAAERIAEEGVSEEAVTEAREGGGDESRDIERHAPHIWPSIPSSFFEPGHAYLKTGTLVQLDPILDFLAENPGWMAFLEGHTDSLPMRSGAFASNDALSTARAQAVMRYLAAKGAAPERIVVRGWGDKRPAATNATPEGRAKNRRVDVTLVPPGTDLEGGFAAAEAEAEADTSLVRAVPAAGDPPIAEAAAIPPAGASASAGCDSAAAVDRHAMSAPADEAKREAASAAKRFGILEPPDRSVVTSRDRIEVVVRVPLGGSHTLAANEAAVPDKHIGKREIHLDDRVEEITYYGVRIGSGWTALRLRAESVDGSAAVEQSVSVALAGRPAAIALSPRRVILPADGRSSAAVRVELRDELGHPAINGLLATVVEGDSLLANADENPGQSGVQVASREGVFLLVVRPSAVTGRGRIAVESHGLSASCVVAYVPPERRMFLTGVVEGRLGVYDTSGNGDPLGIEDYDDGLRAAGDSRFFVQGTTVAGINLTARVDTRKRYDDPLLKTDNPETQYAVYGDASQVHYAAPAQSGNYVALEKGQSYLRYGDFRSPLTAGEFLRYKTSATGLNAAFATGASGVSAFVTKSDYVTVRDEIPGGGTSGYYFLSRAPVVENSVDLVVEVRDRYRPEQVVESRPLVEHRDFTVNYFNGAVLFKEPVPAFSREMNPVTIVAVYESDSPEEGDYLYGLRGDLAGNGRYRLGASALTRDGDGSDYAVYGADGSVSFGAWDLSGEIARSDDDVAGRGGAYKLQLGTKEFHGEHSVYVRKVDGDFLNPSFAGSAHELFAEKAGLDSRLALTRALRLETHAHRQRFSNSGEEKDNVDVVGRYERASLALAAGVRAARQERDGEEREGLLSIVGVGLGAGSRAEMETRWEMNHAKTSVDDYPDRLKSAFSFAFLDGYKVVAAHEYLSAHDRSATHQLLAGLEARAGRNATVYSKYAMNRTAGDARLGTITGLKQVVSLGPDFSGSFDIEGFRSFSNRGEDEYVAVKTGLGRLEKGESLLEGHYEYRWQRAADHHLMRVNAVREMGEGVAILFKDALSVSAYDGRKSSLRMEGRLAGVYRPIYKPFKTLALLKTQYDRYSPVDPDAIVWTTVVSTDVNYAPAPAYEFRLKLAAKRVENWSFGISETGGSYLVLSQAVYRFAKNWDADLWGRFLGKAGAGTSQTGAGIEIGRVLFDRLRIGAGYSVNGFEDRDLAERDAWEKGFGLRVQLILSDWMFSGYEF